MRKNQYKESSIAGLTSVLPLSLLSKVLPIKYIFCKCKSKTWTSLTRNCSFFFPFLKKMFQIVSSLVLQPSCTSQCLLPPKPPNLGSLVYFRARVFNDLFNLKLITFICLAILKRQTFIYSSLSVKRNISCFSILSVKYSYLQFTFWSFR